MSAIYVIGTNKELNLTSLDLGFEKGKVADFLSTNIELNKEFYYISSPIISESLEFNKDLDSVSFVIDGKSFSPNQENKKRLQNLQKIIHSTEDYKHIVLYKFWLTSKDEDDDINWIYEKDVINVDLENITEFELDFNTEYTFV